MKTKLQNYKNLKTEKYKIKKYKITKNIKLKN